MIVLPIRQILTLFPAMLHPVGTWDLSNIFRVKFRLSGHSNAKHLNSVRVNFTLLSNYSDEICPVLLQSEALWLNSSTPVWPRGLLSKLIRPVGGCGRSWAFGPAHVPVPLVRISERCCINGSVSLISRRSRDYPSRISIYQQNSCVSEKRANTWCRKIGSEILWTNISCGGPLKPFKPLKTFKPLKFSFCAWHLLRWIYFSGLKN